MEEDIYLRRMGYHVQDSKIRKYAQREIQEHLEDKTEYYMSRGMKQEEAKRRALEETGSPDFIGKQIDWYCPPKVEWKAGLFVILFSSLTFVAVHVFKIYEAKLPDLFYQWTGIILFLIGIAISVFEIYMDFGFIYSVAGIVNGSALCGIGVGILSMSFGECSVYSICAMVFVLVQRQWMRRWKWMYRNQYLFSEGKAITEITYAGQAYFGGRKKARTVFFYNNKEKNVIQKGEIIHVTAVDGFRLVVERKN